MVPQSFCHRAKVNIRNRKALWFSVCSAKLVKAATAGEYALDRRVEMTLRPAIAIRRYVDRRDCVAAKAKVAIAFMLFMCSLQFIPICR